MASAMAAGSAFEILRSTKQLPVEERVSSPSTSLFGKKTTPSTFSSSASAWGKGEKKWRKFDEANLNLNDNTNIDDDKDTMPRELRTLVAASFDVFMRLARVSEGGRELGAFEIVSASREYREALKTCIFAIEDLLEQQQQNDEQMDGSNAIRNQEGEEDEEFVDLLKVSLAIWHLCELFFLQRRARDDKWIAYDLARWLQEHYASAQMEQLEVTSLRLKHSANAEHDPEFWPTVHSLVMMGCGPSAWSLLAKHSGYKSLFAREMSSLTGASTRASFQSIQRLLHSMPGKSNQLWMSQALHDPDGKMLDTHDAVPVEWKNWHDACQHLLNTDSFIKSNGNFITLLKIMTAQEDVLKNHAHSWYELMMARLFLEEPKKVAHRLEFLMANCYRIYHADESTMGNFDCIILAILQRDIQSALQDINGLGFAWMAAHLADLLEKSSVISIDTLDGIDCSLREFCLLQYAIDIGSTSGMWQFALGYFENCRLFGSIAIRSILNRESVRTDYKANRLLSYCQGKTGLSQVQRNIAIRRALVCKQNKSFGAAIQWMLRGNQLDEVDILCDDILDECNLTDSLSPLHDAVEFLEGYPEMARTQRLLWLVRYREFYLVLDDRETLKDQMNEMDESDPDRAILESKFRFVSKEATKRIHLLMSSAVAPKMMRTELLQVAEQLLKTSPTVFDTQHLYSLMAYIHQLDRSFDRHEFYASVANQKLKGRVEKLVARNLSDAILIEGGCSVSVTSASIANHPMHSRPAAPQFLIANSSFMPMKE